MNFNDPSERIVRLQKNLPMVVEVAARHRRCMVTIFALAVGFLLWYLFARTFNQAPGPPMSEDKTIPFDKILLVADLQAVFLVSVISLILARGAELARIDHQDLFTVGGRLTRLEQELQGLGKDLTERKQDSDFKDATLDELVRRTIFPSATPLPEHLDHAVRHYAALRQIRDHIPDDLAALERRVETLRVSPDRIVMGYLFAFTATIPALVLQSELYQNVRSVRETSFVALVSVCIACAASSYALLGRRTTTEKRFIEDLKMLGVTTNVVKEIVQSSFQPVTDSFQRDKKATGT